MARTILITLYYREIKEALKTMKVKVPKEKGLICKIVIERLSKHDYQLLNKKVVV